jgi:hypothetical protein
VESFVLKDQIKSKLGRQILEILEFRGGIL